VLEPQPGIYTMVYSLISIFNWQIW
jgi:hypothetical protein